MTDEPATPAGRETPVVLSKIYTRTGDGGTTMLGDMSRTAKTDPRLIAYADTEEANAAIGLAIALTLPEDITAVLERVQNELFDVGSDLCQPGTAESARRIDAGYVSWLEEQCDRFNEELRPLRSFILPGGPPAVAQLHVARTVVRRAERSAWVAMDTHGDVNPMTAKYLNRLSDLLFILCRTAGAGQEILWRPGASRT